MVRLTLPVTRKKKAGRLFYIATRPTLEMLAA
jgi:hypothetical protein